MKGIVELEQERWEWSKVIFSNATKESSLLKARKELDEIEENHKNGVRDPFEYADVLMCVFDSAQREGISVEEILEAYADKNKINIHERVWVKNPDDTYSHVKTND